MNKEEFNNYYLKKQVKLIIEKAKKLNLIKPLSAAFDDFPCEVSNPDPSNESLKSLEKEE